MYSSVGRLLNLTVDNTESDGETGATLAWCAEPDGRGVEPSVEAADMSLGVAVSAWQTEELVGVETIRVLSAVTLLAAPRCSS